MLFHRPTWYDKNIDQGTKFISGTDMSGCLHCCDWICHGTGLRLHTWFTEDLFVFDGRYYRILTSFWFRLNCLSSVLHHREKNLTCWAWLAVVERQKHEVRESLPSGHFRWDWFTCRPLNRMEWWFLWNDRFLWASASLCLSCTCLLGMKPDLPLEMGHLVNPPLGRCLPNKAILRGREERG